MIIPTPTPDLIAEMVADAIGIYGWAVSRDGNVVSIGVSPTDDDPDFRAIVVPADADPFVTLSPALLDAMRALYRSHVAGGSLPADQAATLTHEAQEALLALSPDQMAVLADEQDGDDDA
ncbi:hypothetical protein [Nonomuraea wenchangensis]|uniref:Uncharacterized protein n=1 Tax=Nonomuraea wenchangensis TaxID=568860 RepID=A0A1I0F0T0_9ACTN|nr:hypothetical protein [Nonomuraea wenchangensis]SET51555.1 hypothetical protein SAMN05421811_103282 [Nonomuraea wenchangensis]